MSSPGSFLRPAFSKAAEVKHLFPTAVHALGEVPANTLGTGKKRRKKSRAPVTNLCLDFSKDTNFL